MKRASFGAASVIVVAAIVAGAIVTGLLPGYWIYLATSVLISAIALQSIGLVSGRTGMIALCQMSFAGVGAWTVGFLNVGGAPGNLPIWIIAGGLAAVPFGVAIGLPALRLRGINLAIVTLGFATAFDAVLASITFPGQTKFIAVPRPDIFDSDGGYFIFVLIFYVILAVALEFLIHTRLGAIWLAVRHSERAAAAHGISIPGAKLSAFAISAFIAGISGGMLAGYLGTLVADNFNMMQSLALFVVSTMTGAQFADGALIGAILATAFPEILRRLNLGQDIGNVLFALGATQALSTGETISETLRRKFWGWRTAKPTTALHPDAGNPPPASVPLRYDVALATKGLTVRYGTVVALQDVDLAVPEGAVYGLIGPNGAGKSTLIDAVAGFLHSYTGSVELAGQAVDDQPAHVRARGGIRRTWQTTRIAPELTVGAYLRLAGGKMSNTEVEAILNWIECPHPDTLVASVDAGTRRLLDVAGVVAARPKIVLLDEPAAGQSLEETVKLGKHIAEIPKLFGCAVLLVEHDMDLVRAACTEITVLDFGKVIASGPPTVVLEDPRVRKAYLGIEEGNAAA
jgi:branched-chain amino acid transport system permease protein